MKTANMKILLIGDTAVGKSSLMNRFVSDSFNEDIQSTIGADLRQKTIQLEEGGPTINAALWDTAGQESFRSLGTSFYRKAHAALVVYDVTRKASFDGLEQWIREARSHVPDVVLMLVANKIDKLVDEENESPESAVWRAKEKATAEQFAQEHEMMYVRASAKTREGVQHAFEAVARKASQTPEFRALLDGGGASHGGAGAAASSNRSGSVNLAATGGRGDGGDGDDGGGNQLGCGC